ncbi:hypothetical protein FE257_012050 [Aspergillus nanangensis]|uniref:C2H2-type domain-containing protein n=1 Tax=Aspergillus nanangensis TaxID=2582783 RepID=A0AAD4CGK8_ASPNN|nr:hypothetical protein FE257_012050 [Aspergillus nanangensis]
MSQFPQHIDWDEELSLELLDPRQHQIPPPSIEDFVTPSFSSMPELLELSPNQESFTEVYSSFEPMTDEPSLSWPANEHRDVFHTTGSNPMIPFNDLITSSDHIHTNHLFNANITDPAITRPPSSRETASRETGIPGPVWTPDSAPTIRTSLPSLPRRRSRYFTSQPGQSAPISIPNEISLDPMQRWQESPPEDEPASMSAILDAVRNAPEKSRRPKSGGSSHGRSTPNSYRHPRHRAHSTASAGSSGASRRSANSATSGSLSLDSVTMAPRKSRARTFKPKHSSNATDKNRRFCCTFCCDRFKNKYDWARHEKSLHLNLEAWVCAPHGPSVFSPITNRTHCSFCNALDPTPEHLTEHNYHACRSTTNESRAFRRKDHLVQHLRVVHHLQTLPLLDDWKVAAPAISSRCGFCNHPLSTWTDRVSHLSDHFRQGATMKDWRGDHGFAPDIAAKVTHSLPPYLIASESRTLIPFSATSTEIRDHFDQISSRADWRVDQSVIASGAASAESVNPAASQLSSFTQVLTLHLSRYARQQMQLEWLAAFRRLLEEQQNTSEQGGAVG